MADIINDSWLLRVVEHSDGYEADAVGRFANRLLAQARGALPGHLRSRVDPEDVIQSVFQSFFRKHEQNRFEFSSANDVWKLLSAMTYQKVANKIRFHHRECRDVGRESELEYQEQLTSKGDVPSGSAITIMAELLQALLDKLTPMHRQILLMRLEDFTIVEIADHLDVSSRTVDRALLRVRDICVQLNNPPNNA